MKNQKTVLITGTSSGIGLACVHALIQEKYRVFATVRKKQDAESLKAKYGDLIDILLLDITDSTLIESLAQELSSKISDHGLDALINNAGLAIPGTIEMLPIESLRQQIEINLIGQVALTQKLIPLLRQTKGKIINISSLSGRITFPFMGAYCASKYGLEAVSDALRIELKSWEIKVILIQPGRIKTKIFDKAINDLENLKNNASPQMLSLYQDALKGAEHTTTAANGNGIDPEAVAQVITKVLKSNNPKPRYLVGKDAWSLVWAKNILPDRWLDFLVNWGYKRSIAGKPI